MDPNELQASIYDEIPFLQNVLLTDLVRNMKLEGDLRGRELIPDRNIFSRKTEWETVFGGRTIAPIVAQDTATPLVKAPGAQRHAAEAVDIRAKYALSENDVLFLRTPGTREQRRAGEEVIEERVGSLRNMVEARREAMVWDVLLNGETTYQSEVDGKLLTFTYDYGIPATQMVSASTLWTSSSASKPKNDFRAAAKIVREATGRRVKTVWMNTNTHDLLDDSESMRTDRRFTGPAFDELQKAEHVTDILHNIRIINYDEGHFGDAVDELGINGKLEGTFEYYLPDGKAVFLVTGAGARDMGERWADFAVAPSELADGSVVQGLFGERFRTFDPTRTYLRVGMVGIPRVFHGDWHVTMDVAPQD